MHFWSKIWIWCKKVENYIFLFWVILPSGTSIWAYYSKVSCEVAEWCFFEQKQFAELISWNKMIENHFPSKWFPIYKSKKSTFRLLSFLRGCRVHREARGAQGALWSKKHILRFGAKRYTFCENELILAKFWLWAAPCRKAYKRNGILVILEPQNGKSQLLGAKVHFCAFCAPNAEMA